MNLQSRNGRVKREKWSIGRDLNPQRRVWKTQALPLSYRYETTYPATLCEKSRGTLSPGRNLYEQRSVGVRRRIIALELGESKLNTVAARKG